MFMPRHCFKILHQVEDATAVAVVVKSTLSFLYLTCRALTQSSLSLVKILHPNLARKARLTLLMSFRPRPPLDLGRQTVSQLTVDLFYTWATISQESLYEFIYLIEIMFLQVEQLHKIFKLCGSPPDEYWKSSKLPRATLFRPQHHYESCIWEAFRNLPKDAVSLIETLLRVEPHKRGTAASALGSEVLLQNVLMCVFLIAYWTV